jgi:hypothetical protein
MSNVMLGERKEGVFFTRIEPSNEIGFCDENYNSTRRNLQKFISLHDG